MNEQATYDATRIAECIVATAEREIDRICLEAGLDPDTDDDEFERALDAHGSTELSSRLKRSTT